MQDALFTGKERSVITKLKARRGRNYAFRVVEKDVYELYDESEWNARYVTRGRSTIEDILDQSAKAHVNTFRLGIDFTLQNPITQAWIDQRAAFWARSVNKTTGNLLLAELQEGVALGESIPLLTSRVEKVFAGSRALRAEAIARTETATAANAGHLQTYRQAAVPQKKWITTRDMRERGAHAGADGQIVKADEDFSVGGESLSGPGQGGSAWNVINCRCTTRPIWEDGAPGKAQYDPAQFSGRRNIAENEVAAFLQGSDNAAVTVHRTNSKFAKNIADEGVQIAKGDPNGMYGQGFYTSESAMTDFGREEVRIAIRSTRPLRARSEAIWDKFNDLGVSGADGATLRKALVDEGYDSIIVERLSLKTGGKNNYVIGLVEENIMVVAA
jgi:SPP1 gp7 family putative phage head morphogenesis protein